MTSLIAVSLLIASYKQVESCFSILHSLLTTTTTTTRSFILFSMRSFEIIVSLSLALGVSALAAPVNPRYLNTVRYSLYFLQLLFHLLPIGEPSRI